MKNLTRTEPTDRIVFYFLFYGTLILGILLTFVAARLYRREGLLG